MDLGVMKETEGKTGGWETGKRRNERKEKVELAKTPLISCALDL